MTHHTPYLSAAVVDLLVLDSAPYLSCDDCFDQVDDYVEQRAVDPRHEDVPMEMHVRACSACAEEAEALTQLLTSENAGGGVYGA